MSTSRATLRALLGDAMGMGEYMTLTASAQGGASGATLIDTAQGNRATDFSTNWWAVLTLGPTGSGSYEARQVSTFAPATGTYTPVNNFTAQISSGAAYELHRRDPALLHKALNRACELLYPYIFVPKRDESLVVNNLLANSDFETFSGGFTSWTETGSPTVTAETTIKWHGAQAAKVVAGGSIGRLTQAPQVNVKELTTKSATFKAWVYCTAASTARIRLDWDGTNYANSSYHTGADQWELLDVAAEIPDTATQVKAVCETAASGTAYFDAAYLVIDQENVYRYTVPSSILVGPYSLSLQNDPDHPDSPYTPIEGWHVEADSASRYILLDWARPAGYRLRITGTGALSTMSTDTGTTEVDAPLTNTLIAQAMVWLNQAFLGESATATRGLYEAELARWQPTLARYLATPGMRSQPIGARVHLPWAVG